MAPLPASPDAAATPPVAAPQAHGSLLDQLVASSRRFDSSGSDPERNCWMAVHEHIHGVLPSEYDIREIDEDLYLAVLQQRREQDLAG